MTASDTTNAVTIMMIANASSGIPPAMYDSTVTVIMFPTATASAKLLGTQWEWWYETVTTMSDAIAPYSNGS